MKLRNPAPPLLMLAVATLLCGPAGLGYASGPLEKMTMIPEDPNSTFLVETIWHSAPFVQVEVDFGVDSDRVITQFGSDLRWDSAEMTLVSVAPGPGLPPGSTLEDTPGDGSLGLNCILPPGGVVLPNDQALVVLTFDPGCFGFGSRSDIVFYEDPGSNNNNFFNSDGISYSPATTPGGIVLASNFQFLVGQNVEALPLASDVQWDVTLHNTVSSRLNTVEVLYDEALLSVSGVAAGPDLDGTITDWDAAGGVLTVTIDGNFLPGGTHEFLSVFYGLDTPADDYSTTLDYGSGIAAETLCGPTAIGGTGGGITVPDFTAVAEVKNVSVHRTASWFLVPVEIDANMPVHGYSLYMDYPPNPPGAISYLDIQTTGIDAPEVLYNEAEGRLFFSLADRGTPYFGAGSQVVFKIKFGLASGQSAGTQHQVTFDHTRANRVAHIVSDGTPHEAIPPIMVDGTITLTNPPVTCPALSVWNGKGYDLEDNILAACNGTESSQDVVEYYQIQGDLVPASDGLRIRLSEDASAVTTLKDLALIAIDHAADQRIRVDSDGEILALGHAIGLQWARDHRGNDVTTQLLAPDDDAYQSDEAGWIEMGFGELPLNKGEVAPLAGIGVPPPKEHDRIAKSGATTNRLRVLVRDAAGEWRLAEEIGARERAVQQATFFESALLPSGQELVLRLEWEGRYSLDVFELNRTRPFEGSTHQLAPIAMVHSERGAVGDWFGKAGSEPLLLEPQQSIDFLYDHKQLPELEEGSARDYVLRAEGRYETPESDEAPKAAFALGENVPNPFNPSTTISYSLAADGLVRLSIHDVRGALVRLLVHEKQPRGTRSVVWNGRDDRDQPVASGVYFYMLEAGAMKETQKMLLLK